MPLITIFINSKKPLIIYARKAIKTEIDIRRGTKEIIKTLKRKN